MKGAYIKITPLFINSVSVAGTPISYTYAFDRNGPANIAGSSISL